MNEIKHVNDVLSEIDLEYSQKRENKLSVTKHQSVNEYTPNFHPKPRDYSSYYKLSNS